MRSLVTAVGLIRSMPNKLLIAAFLIAAMICGAGGCSRNAARSSAAAAAALSESAQNRSRAAMPSKTPINLGKTSKIRFFLVNAVGSENAGDASPCNKDLVAVDRTVKPTATPLRAAIDELLAAPEQTDANGRLVGNFVRGPGLHAEAVEIRNGAASISIAGSLDLDNSCRRSLVLSQIEATARQFPSVRSVSVILNGVTLTKEVSEGP